MILRLTIAVFLIHNLFAGVIGAAVNHEMPAIAAAALGVLLLIGLWTPITALMASGIELWVAFSKPEEFWTSALASAIASSLALLGPGAWSLDAIAYGRKRISIPNK